METIISTAYVPTAEEADPTVVLIGFTISSLYPDIKRHLSVIGKRTANKNGENVFSQITISSAEEPIFLQYIQQASQNVVAAINQFVSNYVDNGSFISFKVTNTRWNDPTTPNFVEAFRPALKKYLVMYTVAEYLSMNFPELAKKYFDAVLQAMQAIIQLVFFKAPPPSQEVVVYPTYSPVPLGTSSYEFYVPTRTIINLANKLQSIDITLTRGGSEASTSSIVLRRSDGTTGLFTNSSYNSFTGDTTITAYQARDLSTNLADIGEFSRFMPGAVDSIHDGDILTITPTP